jgi:hypothetical protein
MRGRTRIPLLVSVLLLSACSLESTWADYYHDEAVPYYLYLPSNPLAGPPPLMVVLLGAGGSAAECFDLWQPIAEDRELALVCPELPEETLADPRAVELRLSEVLTGIYRQATLRPSFFMVGFAEAGAFALEYAFRYPDYVSGVSAMSVEVYPPPSSVGSHIPFQFAVGEDDRVGQAAADATAGAWRGLGLLVRVVTVEGNGESPNLDFARLAGELAWQVSRQAQP